MALRLQISAGQMHSAAVSSSGDLYMWGYGRFHQLGFGVDEDLPTPTALPPLKGSTAGVACGALHTTALLHGGGVMTWGANQARREVAAGVPGLADGALGHCRPALAATGPASPWLAGPLRLPPPQNGVLGLGHEKNQQPKRPSRVPGLADVTQVSAGWKHNGAVTSGGRLFTWGWGGSQGEPGCWDAAAAPAPVLPTLVASLPLEHGTPPHHPCALPASRPCRHCVLV